MEAAPGDADGVAAAGGVLAWWSGSVAELLAADSEAVVNRLARHLVEAHPVNRSTQLEAWRVQLVLMREALADIAEAGGWRLLLEYPLLRLGRRIDAVLLTDRAIVVLEFKVGAALLSNQDRVQVEDYALDLFDFHAASRSHPIVPVLVATAAKPGATDWPLLWHGVAHVLDASATTLASLLAELRTRIPPPSRPLDAQVWERAAYRPVPTIVEAATMLYRRHSVAEIAAARADVDNLGRTTQAILSTIAHAEAASEHVAIFVTGIPGAGKTLCGLNAVFGAATGAAFLTGNPPLVHVLREALARDAAEHGGSLRMARQKAESAIQPLLGFLRDSLERSESPHEHVIVFDEAQRAWDAEYGRRKFGRPASEAALFLDIMRRHQDWAVIIALVGQGQEINTGEAGLSEWGRALVERPGWRVRAAPDALAAGEPRQRLGLAPDRVQVEPALQLSVPVRSIRSAAAAPWVDTVLGGESARAAGIAAEAQAIPFLLTRSLAAMRASLRVLARGTRRAGLVCSTGARRLRADGIWPDFPHLDEKAIADWFLRRWPDVRASDALEQPATQFACQGLELDVVGLCWGGDLVRQGGGQAWRPRSFRGNDWIGIRNPDQVAWRTNTYRVLLTRARYETVIWVPEGSDEDATRDRATLDAVADFLAACGARPIGEVEVATSVEVAGLL